MPDLQTITVTNGWPASPHYTAAANVDLSLNNPTSKALVFAVRANATAPGVSALYATQVSSTSSHGLQLLAGQTLFIAMPDLDDGDSATVGLQD